MLGAQGLRRIIPDDPPWLEGLLRATIALGSLSLVLRLIAAVIVATKLDGGHGPAIDFIGLFT